MTFNQSRWKLTAIAAVTSTLILAGCGQADDTTTAAPGNPPTPMEQRADQTTENAADWANETREQAAEVAENVQQSTQEAIANITSSVEDSAITATVKAELAMDDDLRGLNVEVETTDGAVELAGEVPDERTRERILAVAENVRGVQGVTDRMTVNGQSS